jgi:hypothetical protein
MVPRRSWVERFSFMRSIVKLVDEIRNAHFAFDPATQNDLDRLISLGMPNDLLEFYSLTNGAFLHKDDACNFHDEDGNTWNWSILSAGAIQTVAESGWSHDVSPIAYRHKLWYQLVDAYNSDYLCISLEEGHRFKIIDTFHETLNLPNYNAVVAHSFTELLESLLASRKPFWLKARENTEYF